MSRSGSTENSAPPASKLSGFCGRLIEACWLTAVAVTPLIIDPHSVHGFDPIKMALLRMLGLVVVGALLVRAMEFYVGSPSARRVLSIARWPAWIFASLALVLVCAVATVFSLDPQFSLWGSPQFVQGTFSLMCNLALFAGLATHLRSREQMDRLVVVALAASVPVTIYALIQRAGLNPVEFDTERLAAIAFAGHPIYLAGYLLMLMPLCVWRLWRGLDASGQVRLHTFAWAVLLLLQFCAFIATEKRGPFVALVIGGACALALIAARQKRFRVAAWGFGIAAAVALLLSVLAVCARAGFSISEAPLLGRLSMIVPVGGGTGDVFRDTLWAEAPPVVTAADSFTHPGGEPDRWRTLRPWIGFGPETLQCILSQFWSFPAAGPAVRLESRFHNGFWDTWQSIGLLGVVAFLFFHVAIYAAGCRSIGFSARGNGEMRLAIAASGLGIVCGAAMSLLFGGGYFGLGFPLGVIGGLLGTTFWSTFRRDSAEDAGSDRSEWLLVVALLAALLGHWVDMAFAFETSGTLALFWIFSGAIAGFDARHNEDDVSITEGDCPGRAGWTRGGLVAGVLVGVMLAAAWNPFLSTSLRTSSTITEILLGSLAELQFGRDAIPPILLLASWAFAVFLTVSTLAKGCGWRPFLEAGSVSLAIALLWAGLKAGWLASIGPIPADSAPVEMVVAMATRLEMVGPAVLILCLGATFAVAGLLTRNSEAASPRAGAMSWAAAGLAVVLILPVIGFAVINIPRNGAWSRLGDALNQFGRKAFAVTIYEGVLQRDPTDMPARIFCSGARMEIAERSREPAAFSAAMNAAEGVLLEGIRRSDLNRGNYYLGRLYLRWALRETDEAARSSLALRARDALLRATRFCPGSEAEWVEASIVEERLFGDQESAREKLLRADAITRAADLPAPYIDPAPWGDYYAYQSFSSHASVLKEIYARRAIRYYDRAISEEQEASVNDLRSSRRATIAKENLQETLISKAKLLISLGEHRASVICLRDALEISTEAGTWEGRAILTQVYAHLGDRAAALREMATAIDEAPPEAEAELTRIQRTFGGMPVSQEEPSANP